MFRVVTTVIIESDETKLRIEFGYKLSITIDFWGLQSSKYVNLRPRIL